MSAERIEPVEAGRRIFAEKQQGAVIKLVEEMLETFGGLLFDGFRDDAPATKRQPF